MTLNLSLSLGLTKQNNPSKDITNPPFNWLPPNFKATLSPSNTVKATYDSPAPLIETQTFYVDNNGNDANDGSSPANAVETLTRVNALIRATSSGTICKVVLTSGQSFAGWRAFVTAEIPNRDTIYTTSAAATATITKNAFTGGQLGYAIHCNTSGIQIEIRNLVVEGYILIGAASGNTALIEDCTIQNSETKSGIGIANASIGYIKNCTITNCDFDGLTAVDNTARIVAEKCTIYANGNGGSSRQNVTAHAQTTVVLINCSIYDAQDQNISIIGDSQLFILGQFAKGIETNGGGTSNNANIRTADQSELRMVALDAEGYHQNAANDPDFDLATTDTSTITYQYMDITGWDIYPGSDISEI